MNKALEIAKNYIKRIANKESFNYDAEDVLKEIEAAEKSGAELSQKPVIHDRKKPQANNDDYYIAAFHHPFEPVGYNWWRPNCAGYTPLISQAGIYTHEDAMRLTFDDDLQVAVPVAFSRELKLQKIYDESEKIYKIFSSQTNLQAAIAHFLGSLQGENK